jgi:hypothetical protein
VTQVLFGQPTLLVLPVSVVSPVKISVLTKYLQSLPRTHSPSQLPRKIFHFPCNNIWSRTHITPVMSISSIKTGLSMSLLRSFQNRVFLSSLQVVSHTTRPMLFTWTISSFNFQTILALKPKSIKLRQNSHLLVPKSNPYWLRPLLHSAPMFPTVFLYLQANHLPSLNMRL